MNWFTEVLNQMIDVILKTTTMATVIQIGVKFIYKIVIKLRFYDGSEYFFLNIMNWNAYFLNGKEQAVELSNSS